MITREAESRLTTPSAKARSWISSSSALLTERRIRAHAIILALCLWGVCAVDYATPGILDRTGAIKFQDFLQFPISARLIAQGRTRDLYDDKVLAAQIRAIAGRDTRIVLWYFYGPQVAVCFIPLLPLPFLAQASIWVALSLMMYFVCVYLLWKSCSSLGRYRNLVALCAIAYPPLFHFFVRGHISAVALVFFTAAYFALRARHNWLAGIALGCLVFKPQFLVAIPLVLLLARAWSILAAVVISAAAQLAFSALYFGPAVMRSYLDKLIHSASHPTTTELLFSPTQMHSLRTFWQLLIPWPHAVWALYLLSSLTVIAIAAAIWKSASPLALRFSALILAAVLVNPHIYIYDLLALAPALLLLAGWALDHPQHRLHAALSILLYLGFLLPLFGPLSRWTHLQLSVPVFAAILWLLYRFGTEDHELASAESRVV